jgi:hypothetical protein
MLLDSRDSSCLSVLRGGLVGGKLLDFAERGLHTAPPSLISDIGTCGMTSKLFLPP